MDEELGLDLKVNKRSFTGKSRRRNAKYICHRLRMRQSRSNRDSRGFSALFKRESKTLDAGLGSGGRPGRQECLLGVVG